MGILQTYSPYDHCLGVAMNKFSYNGFFLSLGIYDDTIHILNTYTNKLIVKLTVTN
jgi:hypothetical protein